MAVEYALGGADARCVLERLGGAECGGVHRTERVPRPCRADGSGRRRGDVRAISLRHDPDDATGGRRADVNADGAVAVRQTSDVEWPAAVDRVDGFLDALGVPARQVVSL